MAAADDLRGLQGRLIRLEREETTGWSARQFAPSLCELHWTLPKKPSMKH